MKLACPEIHHFAVLECSKKVSSGAGASGVAGSASPDAAGLSCAHAASAKAIRHSTTAIAQPSRIRQRPARANCQCHRIVRARVTRCFSCSLPTGRRHAQSAIGSVSHAFITGWLRAPRCPLSSVENGTSSTVHRQHSSRRTPAVKYQVRRRVRWPSLRVMMLHMAPPPLGFCDAAQGCPPGPLSRTSRLWFREAARGEGLCSSQAPPGTAGSCERLGGSCVTISLISSWRLHRQNFYSILG